MQIQLAISDLPSITCTIDFTKYDRNLMIIFKSIKKVYF